MEADREQESERRPRVIVAAGGTAGHVVPALAVADELRVRGAEVAFIGSEDRIETEIVPAAGYRLDSISISGLNRRNPLKAAKSAIGVLPATARARGLLKERRADVVLGGGGYVVGPVGTAALTLRIPLVLTEADRHLGLANRALAARAHSVCLAYPHDGDEPENRVVTGRAVGREVLAANRVEARERFGIDLGKSTLLVMGGSQGARSINIAAVEAFARDLGREFHVLHLAGRRDYAEVREKLLSIEPHDYTLLEYEPNLGACLAASDLVLTRSGGSIFEVMARGLPAVLVPYPHATGDHQRLNAEWMAEGGAAVVIDDAKLTAESLSRTVRDIFTRTVPLAEMSAASRALAKPDAAAYIADRVIEASREGNEA